MLTGTAEDKASRTKSRTHKVPPRNGSRAGSQSLELRSEELGNCQAVAVKEKPTTTVLVSGETIRIQYMPSVGGKLIAPKPRGGNETSE
jgi:hypothetical protein